MRAFRIQLSALVAVYTLAVFGALYYQSQMLLYDSLRTQAESYVDLVVETRAWNARYGGVWVEKLPGVETNPYLRELGIDADLQSTDGRRFTLRNPSAMTSEISRLTIGSSGVRFHLVAEDPLNPSNSPDTWEREALGALESGVDASSETIDTRSDPPVYRYMELLKVDESCLECHGYEGYQPGQTRGGVTINIPVGPTETQLGRSRLLLGGLALITLGLAVGTSQWFTGRFKSRLDAANAKLEQMAITDELTGLANRRTVLEDMATEFARARRTGHPVSAMVIDIDYFKRINDTLGHSAGDQVLREVAQRMRENIREYDLIGRIGGEEFLVVSPETELGDARALGERIISGIRDLPIPTADEELRVTASAGVATATPEDQRSDDLIARADRALYAAKDAGRNRVLTDSDAGPE